MKIAHISDIHCRNLKFHSDYRAVFENLYRKLDELKPDLIVNTGDTGHTKTNISPEFVELTSELLKRLAEYAELDIILGNHDLNLMNLGRQDAISPIVDNIGSKRIRLHKKSGLFSPAQGFNFWVFSLADVENYPTPSQWKKHADSVNIGLFHGSVSNCVTDSNWRMTNTEHDLSIFDGLDYVLLGDIHKQQFFRERRMGYAGSLIQQNFGEEIDKGFLFWNIESKERHTVKSIILPGSRKFYTLKLDDDLGFPKIEIDPGSHIRISPPRSLTLSEQRGVEDIVKQTFRPSDVITLSSNSIGTQKAKIGKSKKIDMENIRSLPVQERLLRDFLSEESVPEDVTEIVLDLNRKYQVHVQQQDESARDVLWKVKNVAWDNLFNYGEGNVINLENLRGVTGIFAPNGSGKSNLIDVLMVTFFDSQTKGIGKNVHLINDNKDVSRMVADIDVNGELCTIERTIERVKYGQRKGETKEWGKTSVNFYSTDEEGERHQLVGDLRPETERNIRRHIGTFDDFMLTGLTAQWNPLDIIGCKETERRKIFYKFLDLEIFEQKCQLARDESKPLLKDLEALEKDGLDGHIAEYQGRIGDVGTEISRLESSISLLRDRARESSEELALLRASRRVVSAESDPGVISRRLVSLGKKQDEIGALLAEEKEKMTREQASVVSDSTGSFSDTDLSSSSQRYQELILERQDLSHKIDVLKPRSESYVKDVDLLRKVPCGDMFPKCKFLVNAFDSKEKLSKIGEEISLLSESLSATDSELNRLRPLHEKWTSLKSSRLVMERIQFQLDNLALQEKLVVKEIESNLEALERANRNTDDLRWNEELEPRVYEKQEQVQQLDSQLEEMTDRLNLLNRQMGSYQGILEKLSERLSLQCEMRKRCSAYEHYIRAMGKDGIAYRVLAQKLPLLNEEINKILGGSADFGVYIEHDSEEQSIRLYIQYGEYRSRLLELGSGAEKMLASIAIRTALLSVSNLPKTNLFVIDEGFGKLDPKNLESINMMFDYLRSVFDHIIVISHLDTMKDLVDNIIDITSDTEGYAHVEVA